MMKVNFRRANPDVPLPIYHPESAAAFDLAANESVTIQPGEMRAIGTGLYMDVPEGYFLGIFSRSSTPRRTGLVFPHGVGIVDPHYSGPKDEILVLVHNVSDKPATVTKGERIAQGMFIASPKVEWHEVEALRESSRGGFGSTGHEQK